MSTFRHLALILAVSVVTACEDPASSGETTTADSGTAAGADTSAIFAQDAADSSASTADSAGGLVDSAALDAAAASVDALIADLPPAPGAFGFPCLENSECSSAACLPTADGKKCSQICSETCPKGYACGPVPGSDAIFVCIAKYVHLCDPCQLDIDCKNPLLGGIQFCVDYGKIGKFCATECKADLDCPGGYFCASETHNGVTAGQCRQTIGQCACSLTAQVGQLATTCLQTSPHGTCTGKRFCGKEGLTLCDAVVPSAEVCNAKDDDCDGQSDEGLGDAPCTANNANGSCQGTLTCKNGQSACDAPQPATETCNGKDDNCNGLIDEQACKDNNVCTEDACNLNLGGCVFATVTKPCDDGDVCTSADLCKEGKCAGLAVACDDGDPCTADSCLPTGCAHQPQLNGVCDDNNPCTGTDVCGKTSTDKLACAGIALADGSTCSDGTSCTLAASCASGKCIATQSKCNDANPCTDDGCDSLSGGVVACKHFYTAAACDDGNACTLGDGCLGGKCIGLGKMPCDDENPCSADSCDAAKGCTHTPKAGAVCNDSDVCTTGDVCEAAIGGAACKGKALDCDDKNACTVDSCDIKTGCAKAAKSGACDDGDACTTADFCSGGQCQSGPFTCGECTVSADCLKKEDGDLCNGTLFCEKVTHTCQVDPGTVVQCPPPIGNGAECVQSKCEGKSGKCAIGPTNESGACSDGNDCTSGDACKQGSCIGKYGAAACDDSNGCTQDVCDANKGCTSTPLDGISCTDNNSCTISDTCTGGLCKPGVPLPCDDANPCSSDGCDPKFGCVHNFNTLPCDDGNVCTAGDVCKTAVCTPQKALDCDDNNACTIDGCDAKTGCIHSNNNGLGCNDGNACTSGDKCNAGQCLGAGQLPCSDGNACTDDSCDPKSGCAFTANVLGCNDGNSCTDNDTCGGGACKSTKPTDCNDSNTCTQDLCDPAKGCVYQKLIDGTVCNDGNSCTQSDKCTSGICLGGPKLGCNDNEPCTTDSCDPKKGCVYTPLPDKDVCNDNNACTLNEMCANGKCAATIKTDADKDGHLPTNCGGDDCNDNCATCFPGQIEVCDDFDNDCKDGVDEGCDDDNDDWCDKAMTIPVGVVPKTCTKGGGDCEDTKNAISPGAIEKLEVDIDHKVQTSIPLYNYNPTIGPVTKLAADGTLWLLNRVQSSGIGQNVMVLYAWRRDANSTSWIRAAVDEKNDAGAFAVTIDSAAVPHVIYQDTKNKAVRHAYRTSQGWITELIESKNGIGDYVAIAPGPGGIIHVAYYDGAAGDLRYANNDGGKWTPKIVESTNDVGQFTSIGVAASGAVHIAYLDYTNQDLRYASDANSPGTFTSSIVDGKTTAAGFYASLGVDNGGKVHISHYELVGSDLVYTTNVNGAWQSEIIDQPGTVGQFTSLATSAAGTLYISYINVDSGMGKFAVGKLGSWALQNLETVMKATTISVATLGTTVYVAFNGTGQGPNNERTRFGIRTGTTFTFDWVDKGATSDWCNGAMVAFAGSRTSKLGNGDIAGVGLAYSTQLVARWLGSSYEWRLFPAATAVRAHSMAITQGGDWHACGTVTNTNGYSPKGMGYATGTWTALGPLVTVDSATQALTPCSIAMAGDGTAHLTWYDAGNQVMRYSRVKAGLASATEIPDPSFGTGSTQELAIAPDGTLVAVYGGKNVRMATRTGSNKWVIETMLAEGAADVALAIAPDDVRHVLYRKQPVSGVAEKVMYTAWKAGTWSVPLQLSAGNSSNSVYALGLGITVDGNGALHALVGSQSVYWTTAFGAWSPTSLNLGSSDSQYGSSMSVGLVGSRVLLAGKTGTCTQETGFMLSLTYQNLVDDNCDGK
ncbi:MAG: hypothetical protein EXR77_08000 [Myxococcales bacterium]|nr:hypothetical protein [Myxococcales bacterium]